MDDLPDETAFTFKMPPRTVPELDVHRLTELARALAVNLQPEEEILTRFGIAAEDLARLRKNEFFKNALENFTQEWNSPLTTPQRMKIKSAMILEDSLPTLAQRMVDNQEPLRDSIEAAKLFAKMGDIGEQKNGIASAERVSITINIGTEKLTFEKTPVVEISEIQPLPEGPREELSLPSRPERADERAAPSSEPEPPSSSLSLQSLAPPKRSRGEI